MYTQKAKSFTNSPLAFGVIAYKSSNIGAHKKFFDLLQDRLGIKQWEEWYNIKWKEIIDYGGGALIRKHYENSYIKALTTVYPERKWKIWKFNQVSPSYWKELKNHKIFFDELFNELNLKSWNEWYNVSLMQVNSLGGRGLLSKHYGNQFTFH